MFVQIAFSPEFNKDELCYMDGESVNVGRKDLATEIHKFPFMPCREFSRDLEMETSLLRKC